MALGWGIGIFAVVLPAYALTLTPGDVIKGSRPDLYYYGSDDLRHTFTSDADYKTWFTSTAQVKNIKDSELQAIRIGANMTYRPGTRLIKIATDPKVYAVEPGGVIHAIRGEAVAKALYGAEWLKLVDTINDLFFPDYTIGADLAQATPPIGTLLKIAGNSDLYYVDATGARKFASTDVFTANRFQTSNIRLVSPAILNGLPTGAPITGREAALSERTGPILSIPAQPTPTPVPTTTPPAAPTATTPAPVTVVPPKPAPVEAPTKLAAPAPAATPNGAPIVPKPILTTPQTPVATPFISPLLQTPGSKATTLRLTAISARPLTVSSGEDAVWRINLATNEAMKEYTVTISSTPGSKKETSKLLSSARITELNQAKASYVTLLSTDTGATYTYRIVAKNIKGQQTSATGTFGMKVLPTPVLVTPADTKIVKQTPNPAKVEPITPPTKPVTPPEPVKPEAPATTITPPPAVTPTATTPPVTAPPVPVIVPEPVKLIISRAPASPTGFFTPSPEQVLAMFDVKGQGSRPLIINSLTVKLFGSFASVGDDGGVNGWQLLRDNQMTPTTITIIDPSGATNPFNPIKGIDSGSLIRFDFGSHPLTIDAGSTATFTVKADTSKVRSKFSGVATLGLMLDGAAGHGHFSGNSAGENTSVQLGSLRWDYTDSKGNYGSSGKPTPAAPLDISESYPVFGYTLLYRP